MADPHHTLRRPPAGPAGRALLAVAMAFALAGGLVLVALTVMSLASIAGRALLSKPLPGDYELVQLGTAVAVSAFMPFCQLRGGHVIVDFFTANARRRVRASLDSLGALLIAVAAAVLAWRLAAGAISLRAANDMTTILEFPTWIAVALMVPSFALFSVAGLYTAWVQWKSRDEAERADAAPGANP